MPVLFPTLHLSSQFWTELLIPDIQMDGMNPYSDSYPCVEGIYPLNIFRGWPMP